MTREELGEKLTALANGAGGTDDFLVLAREIQDEYDRQSAELTMSKQKELEARERYVERFMNSGTPQSTHPEETPAENYTFESLFKEGVN